MRKLTLILFIFFLGYIFLDHEKIFDKTNNFLNKKTIQIKLKNTNYVQKDYILIYLYIKNGDNFWVFSREKLKNDLDQIPEIESYSFKLEKNGILSILINEKKPYMAWTFSNKKKIIDQNGNVLNFLKFPAKNLIEVSGYINKKNFFELNTILEKNKNLKSKIQKINYNENIGWQLFLEDDRCLYLPKKKIGDMIKIFNKKINNSKLYFDYKFYDMRIFERIYLSKKNKCLVS